MALDQSALLEILEVLKVADVGDRVRTAAETTYPALIEAELTDTIGAALHERTQTRTNLRNGHRSRALSTPAGDLELRVPKLRTGSFFPSLLERRRRPPHRRPSSRHPGPGGEGHERRHIRDHPAARTLRGTDPDEPTRPGRGRDPRTVRTPTTAGHA
jgi:Transposase, Mutator family